MTDVSPEGRITHGCAGLWNDAQGRAWRRIVEFVHQSSPAKVGMQLAHAGRKGSCRLPWEGDGSLSAEQGAWQTLGPSAIPFIEGSHVPREMNTDDMKKVRDDFAAATARAASVGFDVL